MSRHHADDDLEALGSGSFAPDLLSGDVPGNATRDDDEAALNNLINNAVASANQFSIDDDNENENENGNENSTEDDDAVDEEALYAQDRQEFKLAEKTSQIMQDYRAYLSEMGGDDDGDGDAHGTNGNGRVEDPVAMAGGDLSAAAMKADGYDNVFSLRDDDDGDDNGGFPSSSLAGPTASLARDFTYREDRTVDDDMRAELGMGGRFAGRSRGGGSARYKYPVFRSKRFKRCAFSVAALALVIGSIVGIVGSVRRSKKEKRLPDWEAELAQIEEEQAKKKEGGDANGNINISGQSDGGTISDDTTGAMTPQVSDGLQIPPNVNVPQDLEFISPPPEVLEPSQPSIWFNWNGDNQEEAIEFCGSRVDGLGDRMELCPTSPINDTHVQCCVILSNDTPATVAATTTAATATAVVATAAAAAADSTTTLPATTTAAGTPAAVTTTEVATTTTATTASSTQPDSALTNEQKSLIYQVASISYEPRFFDRTDNWLGKSYFDGAEFCDEQNLALCPYEAICPLGTGNTPMGGFLDATPEGSWVPIINDPNGWVNIGSEDACVEYKHWPNGQGDSGPGWGETGSESLTRRLICCLPVKADVKNFDFETGTFKNPEDAPTMPTTTTSSSTSSTSSTTPKISDEARNKAYEYAAETFQPKWFDREDGWEGKTYAEAIQFCANRDSSIPCPYAAVCPVGTYGIPSFGYRTEDSEAWVPIIDGPNQWVEVTQANSCVKYTAMYPTPPEWGLTGEGSEELTKHIMCCHEPGSSTASDAAASDAKSPDAEITFGTDESSSSAASPSGGGSGLNPGTDSGYVPPVNEERTESEQYVLNQYHPVWLGRDEGYSGHSWSESVDFCRNVGKFTLCPLEAYCPNGPTTERRPLYLDSSAFPNEQWAPVGGQDDNTWVMVGTVDGNPASTCLTHTEIFGGPPTWGTDGTYLEMKENVLCCVDRSGETTSQESNELTAEEVIEKEFKPAWFGDTSGWMGGTYQEALDFCSQMKGRSLCPYEAYCPHGESQPTIGRHTVDFNAEGEQWAPYLTSESEGSNHWVMIGQMHGNSATTCMSHEELEGGLPIWGTTGDWPETKKHVLCCELKLN